MNTRFISSPGLLIACALSACLMACPQQEAATPPIILLPDTSNDPNDPQDAGSDEDTSAPDDAGPQDAVADEDSPSSPDADEVDTGPDAAPDAQQDAQQDVDLGDECEGLALDPLYNADTEREPEILFETQDALVTQIADRARDRHAREDAFQSYDHYLPFYWEQRVAKLEIIDHVAKGGQDIVFNFVTLDRLNPAEFRTFFANAYATYHSNQSDHISTGVTYLGASPSQAHPGETEHAYTSTITRNVPLNRPLNVGDRIEIELSQFLSTPRNGRTNYYGTALLYVVGEGIVPWYAKDREEATTPSQAQQASLDSHPLPQRAWSGGRTTIHYPYSNEPEHRFKQTAGNLSHTSGFAFMDGRRLHHTDFASGQHSEPGNPVFAAHIGKAGPLSVAHNCVSCHLNNGRDIPPQPGNFFPRAVVKVASDAQGSPHPTLGDSLQPQGEINPTGQALLRRQAEDYTTEQGTMTEPTTDTGGGVNIGFLDPGDQLTYQNLNAGVDQAGTYILAFRVASEGNGGRMTITGPNANPVYGSIDTPGTGGWQNWTTVYLPVQLQAGPQSFEFHIERGGWNLNWFEIQTADQSDGVESPVTLSGYTEIEGQYGDGQAYTLRQPIYDFGATALEFYSVRLAPQLLGLGLLEAIDEEDIMALADPCDDDDDGISGRLRVVVPVTSPGEHQVGRLGYKAAQPSVIYQIAAALNRDMGVTNPIFPALDGEDPAEAQNRTPELSWEDLELMRRYVSLLGVPARRGLTDPQVERGEALFAQAGCDACHTTSFTTGPNHPYAELREQDIQPFTDLLLHDMGPGLSDNLSQPGVAASEWRTAPLWGLGLTEGVSGQEAFLHDGRARDLAEAILWHGGEGEAAKEAFRTMSSEDRQALLAFLRSI